MSNPLVRIGRVGSFAAVLAALLAALGGGSCTGEISYDPAGGESGGNENGAGSGPGGSGAGSAAAAGLPGRDLAATLGLRRLTREEYDNTVYDLLGDVSRQGANLLPADVRKPFDDYRAQQAQISDSLLQSVELLSVSLTNQLMRDVPRRDGIIGCRVMDAGCLVSFVESFGRRALRRPLAADEVQMFLRLKQPDFHASVAAIVRAFLQDPELLHRIEVGTPVAGAPGLFALDHYEMASRLSYFLVGSMPSDALFERAAKKRLGSPAEVREAALDILTKDARARDRIALFHGLWLGYERPELPLAMRAETAALLGRVIFDDKKPWKDIFRATDTFVTVDLARYYGLSIPADFKGPSPRWLPYGKQPRQGLLSHGSFLSLAGTMDEQLMTIRRGKEIQERLFCAQLSAKPANAQAGMAPKSPCKWDVMEAHRSSGACAPCHQLLDVVGFGLDNYNALGKFRANIATPDNRTNQTVNCPVRAEGRLNGQPFSGPAALARIVLADGERLNRCAVKQLHRFAFSRNDLDGAGQEFVDLVARHVGNADFGFEDLVLDFVTSPAFAHRRVDTQAN